MLTVKPRLNSSFQKYQISYCTIDLSQNLLDSYCRTTLAQSQKFLSSPLEKPCLRMFWYSTVQDTSLVKTEVDQRQSHFGFNKDMSQQRWFPVSGCPMRFLERTSSMQPDHLSLNKPVKLTYKTCLYHRMVQK